jgi:hypothetical protein
MSVFDECPVAPLAPIDRKVCPFNVGQTQKIAFWRRGETPFTATSILTAAAWTAATTADEPVVVTNKLNNFTIPNSERVEATADTNALGMAELMRGSNPQASGEMRNVSPAEYGQLRGLIPASQIDVGDTDLVFALINSKNEIFYNPADASLGFPAYALFVGSPSVVAEYGGNSIATINWYVEDGWFAGGAKGQIAFDFLRTYPVAA